MLRKNVIDHRNCLQEEMEREKKRKEEEERKLREEEEMKKKYGDKRYCQDLLIAW